MKLILNGINGEYLRNITERAAVDTEYVEAAVAYASDGSLLFDWCLANKLPLHFWGRFDDGLPVGLRLLRAFLDQRSPNFVCKLLEHFHAKVIWWHGVGAYIGSANLSQAAWYNNIEAGCFFEEADLVANAMDVQLRNFFKRVDENASPLTEELFKALEARSRELQKLAEQDREARKRFAAIPSIKHWGGLVHQSRTAAADRNKKAFIDEWYSTLQILRDIGTRIATDANRPSWLPDTVPSGAQADQFLHAHYYNHVIEDRKSKYEEAFEANNKNPERALLDAIAWWRQLDAPPSNEERTLLDWAPFLRDALSAERLLSLSESEFE
ncbi:MAG: hypothetical protein JST16_18830, partial [Bdellovibrionales bacterium]|nr:hypothetical protein [Bdellovibrionales bacterium]